MSFWKKDDLVPDAHIITVEDWGDRADRAEQAARMREAQRSFEARGLKEAERVDGLTEREPLDLTPEQRAALFGTRYRKPDGRYESTVEVHGSITDAIRGSATPADLGESPLQFYARQAREQDDQRRRDELLSGFDDALARKEER